MKLKSIAKYLNTDDIWITTADGHFIHHFEGLDAVKNAENIWGENTILTITPASDSIDIRISNTRV